MIVTRDESLGHISAVLKDLLHKNPGEITESTDLIKDNLLDSLDLMNFLFQLEKRIDRKLDAIDENFNDFKVSAIIDVMCKA